MMKLFTRLYGLLLLLPAVSPVWAQPEPAVPSNKPQVTLTATPGGTVPLKPVPSFYAPGTPVNYVRTKTAMAPETNESVFDGSGYEKVNQSTQYLDGLGRPLQTVVRQVTPGSDPRDMVTPVLYDAFGREAVKYLSYIPPTATGNSDGSFKMDPFREQDNFYKHTYKDANGRLMYEGEQFLYGQTDFEASPLNRVSKSMAPGNSWAGQAKGITQQYLLNTAADGVRTWTVNNDLLTLSNQSSTNIPVSTLTYGAGELFKNVTIDEQGSAVVEYKDKEGQVLLKKVQIGDNVATDCSGYEGWLCTYYVYDDLNRLRFVIPPAAVEIIKSDWSLTTHVNVLAEYCFRYEYDGRNRMINKKVPGTGWTEMIYDTRDRLVYTRDGNMRTSSQWMVTLYDELNRPVVTGMLVPCTLTREQLQPYVDNAVTAVPVTINGLTAFSMPPAISLEIYQPATPLYQAGESIAFASGFNSGNNASLVTAIATAQTSSFSCQVLVTDPRPTNISFVALTITYYDHYSALSGTSYTDSYNNKLDAGTSTADKVNLAPEPVLANASQSGVLTNGLVTGTRVRMLEDPSNPGFGKWLTTTMFYDNQARVIQTHSENALGGKDISTVRYDFTGKALASYLVHNNPAGGGTTTVKTLMRYDFAGRLLTINKTLNDQDHQSMQIVANSYDELGNLKTKELGKKRLAAGPIEKLDYNYHIRGWLKGINAAYSHPELAATATDRWFGMELNYDYGSQTGSNQLNGNISSVTWRSKGDGVQRGFGYTYDKANRILSADFCERNTNSNAYTDNAHVKFDMVMSNGEAGYTGYDANGNIKGMTQWGLELNNSSAIDQLKYDYYPNSNKLAAVSEATPATTHKLGDFTDNNSGTDYGYDANGNMTTDLNKRIKDAATPDLDQSGGAITYNHLNLPWKISLKKDDNTSTKGYIRYRYDALGNKLSKTVHEEGVAEDKVTDYVGGMVYEQNILQFIPHEEGRVRPTNLEGVITHNYDYFLKDHLGNVRMVLTDEQEQSAYPPATLETATINQEKTFYNIPEDGAVRVNADDVAGYPGSSPKGFVHKLSGNGTKVGSSMLLKVMAGDKVHIRVDSWYRLNNANPANIHSATTAISSILQSMVAGSSGGKFTPGAPGASGLMESLVSAFATNRQAEAPAAGKPKAYLNWILFDHQMNAVITNDGKNSGADIVGEGDLQKHHIIDSRELTKSGYLYIYVSNESQDVNLFFDNLTVTHLKGPLMEETHYYPFGLTMAGISSKAAGKLENRYKFNKGSELQNKEFTDGSGLEMYDTHFRQLDPQLGRWWQIDPKPDYSQSLYSAMSNNPISINDPLGDTTIVDRRGYITKQYGKDNLVFLQKGKKLVGIGELGKTIDASKIFKNLLTKNINTAKGIINPNTFRNLVKGHGEWDLKNNQKTIYGVANSFDKGKENKTEFSFQGNQYTAEDIGNYHYGATGNATWFGGEDFLLQQAGAAQISAGTSRPEWQRYGKSMQYYGEQGQSYSMRGPILPPYGDDPHDQEMIKAGVKYYNANKNNTQEEY